MYGIFTNVASCWATCSKILAQLSGHTGTQPRAAVAGLGGSNDVMKTFTFYLFNQLI